MSVQDLTDYEFFSKVVSYDYETGILNWKYREEECFKTYSSYKSWNAKHAGKNISREFYGYVVLSIGRKRFFAHRVIWLLHYKEWPKNQIDHIDGNKMNNKITNLRDVCNQENMKNKSRYKNNQSGVTGVCYNKRTGKWRAYISVKGKRKYLGYVDSKDEAVTLRRAAEVDEGYHENHGR